MHGVEIRMHRTSVCLFMKCQALLTVWEHIHLLQLLPKGLQFLPQLQIGLAVLLRGFFQVLLEKSAAVLNWPDEIHLSSALKSILKILHRTCLFQLVWSLRNSQQPIVTTTIHVLQVLDTWHPAWLPTQRPCARAQGEGPSGPAKLLAGPRVDHCFPVPHPSDNWQIFSGKIWHSIG